MFAKIKTCSGEDVLVDVSDIDLVSQYRWYTSWTDAGDVAAVLANINRRTVTMHRLIVCPPDEMIVDHSNGNPLDNRRANLRICTYSNNNRNRRSKRGSALGVKGVSKSGSKFRAQIYLGGKNHHLGLFATTEEAHAAYANAARLHFGEFARTN